MRASAGASDAEEVTKVAELAGQAEDPMDAASIQPCGDQVFAFGEARAAKFIKFMHAAVQLRSSGHGESRKDGKEKAPRWILVWILIGVRVQMVEAAVEEIPARREMERVLETCEKCSRS